MYGIKWNTMVSMQKKLFKRRFGSLSPFIMPCVAFLLQDPPSKNEFFAVYDTVHIRPRYLRQKSI